MNGVNTWFGEQTTGSSSVYGGSHMVDRKRILLLSKTLDMPTLYWSCPKSWTIPFDYRTQISLNIQIAWTDYVNFASLDQLESYISHLGKKSPLWHVHAGQICTCLYRPFQLINAFLLTHCSLETSKNVIGKQYRPRSDAAECGVWSVSPLFANSSTIFLLEYLNHITWHT